MSCLRWYPFEHVGTQPHHPGRLTKRSLQQRGAVASWFSNVSDPITSVHSLRLMLQAHLMKQMEAEYTVQENSLQQKTQCSFGEFVPLI